MVRTHSRLAIADRFLYLLLVYFIFKQALPITHLRIDLSLKTVDNVTDNKLVIF